MPESRPRVVLWILLISFVAATVSTAGCGRREPVKERVKPKESATSLKQPKEKKLEAEFERARITWDDDKGRRLWEAEFEEALASQTGESAVMELRDVKASLYKDGKVASRLIAPRVVADTRTREVRASGGVKVTSAADSASISAERMTWKSRENKLIGVGTVRMTKGNMEIAAHAFEADTGLKKARFSDGEGNPR